MNEQAGVSDKAYVIVGGSSGLGLSAARALVNHGARVAVCGRSEERLAQALEMLGDNAVGKKVDAAAAGAVDEFLDFACGEIGDLEGLYHVAGGSGRSAGDGPLHELSDEGWDYTIQQNLTSLMMSNRAAVRRFRMQGGGGVILNMGSVLGFLPSPEYFSSHAYAAAKAGVEGFSRSLASYYATEGVRVNVITPALVETSMSERARANDEIMEYVSRKQPLDGGRIGIPGDLDGAVLLLLGEGGRFVTGQVLRVDGGWSVSGT
ncbi:MAG: SDR family oxidoreductase [Roseibacillus sp.]